MMKKEKAADDRCYVEISEKNMKPIVTNKPIANQYLGVELCRSVSVS